MTEPHVPNDTIPTQESREVHRCEAVKPNGAVCAYYVGAKFLDGKWLCRWHRPKPTPAADPGAPPKPTPRPPKGGKIDDPEDAQRLAAWAAQNVALGHLEHQRGNSVANLCREFRRAFAESGALNRWVERATIMQRAYYALKRGDHAAAERWEAHGRPDQHPINLEALIEAEDDE